MKVNLNKIRKNKPIQFIFIIANYLFLIDFIFPILFDRFKTINEFVSEYLPWLHLCLFILYILSLFLGNATKYRIILLPVRLINLIAIIPTLWIALMYLLAALFNIESS